MDRTDGSIGSGGRPDWTHLLLQTGRHRRQPRRAVGPGALGELPVLPGPAVLP